MNDPTLSICIPTYNRATYLEDTINSIVNQKIFQETNKVEIVISDNCSDDNTREVADKYIAIYGVKIQYFRNSENIKDANFEKVLSYGKGLFLKLNNDTLMHHEDALDMIIEGINQNIKNKNILFFTNGVLKNITKIHCEGLNSFVKTVSFYSTWIGGFGIWKDHFDSFDGFSRNANLQLVQTDVLLRLISSGQSVYVYNNNIFDPVNPKLKGGGGYNIYQVFVTNYLGLLKDYREARQISKITLFNEKSKLLIHYLIPWSLTLWRDKTNYSFDRKGALAIVFKEYRFHPIFYIGTIYLCMRFMLNHLKKSAIDIK
jgi:glycosyltransferase involved in cell wall biosynthesis